MAHATPVFTTDFRNVLCSFVELFFRVLSKIFNFLTGSDFITIGPWVSWDVLVHPSFSSTTCIQCSLRKPHEYSAVTEVIAGLILAFTIFHQKIIVDANFFAVTHINKIQILSSFEFNDRFAVINKETSDSQHSFHHLLMFLF